MQKYLKKNKSNSRGDTLVEVLLAITIFSSIAVTSVAIMNSGLNQAQRALEITMARNEIDAQANALRFVHDNYVTEREMASGSQQYTQLWDLIEAHAITSDEFKGVVKLNNLHSCQEAYIGGPEVRDNSNAKINYKGEFAETRDRIDGYPGDIHNRARKGPFVLNPRFLQPASIVSGMKGSTGLPVSYDAVLSQAILNGAKEINRTDLSAGRFRDASLYPRLVYKKLNIDGLADNTVARDDDKNDDKLSEGSNSNYYRQIDAAEGIWVIPVEGDIEEGTSEPQYIDFYVRTCWQPAGERKHSNLITTVRLYNPEAL